MSLIKPFSREFTQDVIDLILDIQRNEFNVLITIDDQPDLLNISSFYQTKKGNFWVAISEDEIVGTIALIDFNATQGALRKMFVKKSFRGSGIAQKLLDTLLAWSGKREMREIYLGTISLMHAARRFYERNGFLEIQKKDLPPGFPRTRVDKMFYRLMVPI